MDLTMIPWYRMPEWVVGEIFFFVELNLLDVMGPRCLEVTASTF